MAFQISRPSRIEWEHWPSDRLFSALLPLLIQGRQDKTVTERIQEQFETKKFSGVFSAPTAHIGYGNSP